MKLKAAAAVLLMLGYLFGVLPYVGIALIALSGAYVIVRPPALRRWLRDNAGQDLIEYALLAALVGMVGVVAWSNIAQRLTSGYTGAGSGINAASACTPDPCNVGAGGNYCAKTYATYCR